MPSEEIEEFAEVLVSRVRDAVIRSADRSFSELAKDPVSLRWRTAETGGKRALASVVIADVVDEALFSLLHAIDTGAINLVFVSRSGKEIVLSEQGHGELAGWYMGSDGWRRKYSKERYYDDSSGMTID
jgi:hypothetical protein